MSEELVDKVLRSMEAWNRGDVDAWLEPAHPAIEWISEIVRRVEGAETVYRGVAEMRAYWEDWHATWDVNIDVTRTYDLGDTVVAVADVRTRGEASGIGLEREVAYVFEFEDGLARRARAYFDAQEALDAAGIEADVPRRE
jgi:ketosteroid isomerase-like protein